LLVEDRAGKRLAGGLAAQLGSGGVVGGGIPCKRDEDRGRVSQALTRLLREFRSQGYALLLRNSNNLVYNLRGNAGNSAPFRNLVCLTMRERPFQTERKGENPLAGGGWGAD
jgi:hypothetical protein